MAELLGKQPRPRGPRLAIVTNGGGPGVLATDTLIANGGESAPLVERKCGCARSAFCRRIGATAIRLISSATPMRNVMRARSKSSRAIRDNDGLLVVLTPQAVTRANQLRRSWLAFAKLEGKPILASFMGGESVREGQAILDRAGIPTFAYPDTRRARVLLFVAIHACASCAL